MAERTLVLISFDTSQENENLRNDIGHVFINYLISAKYSASEAAIFFYPFQLLALLLVRLRFFATLNLSRDSCIVTGYGFVQH